MRTQRGFYTSIRGKSHEFQNWRYKTGSRAFTENVGFKKKIN
jgi:hypothetical protein